MQTISFSAFKNRYDVNFKARDQDEDFLGRGGYGTVFKGYDIRDNLYVAIKRASTDKLLLDEVLRGSKVPAHANIARYRDGFRVE